MTNGERFKELLHEIIQLNPNYKNELTIFKKYLDEKGLDEIVFRLNTSHIDEYFIHCYDTKIGVKSTLTVHIAALKILFNYLITKQYNCEIILGYLESNGFVENLSSKLCECFDKSILGITSINNILYKFDKYIQDNINTKFKTDMQKQKFFEIMIARLYAKLSLIIPIKISEMLELELGNIKEEDIRVMIYNDVTVKMPNSLRMQIIETINYAKNEYNMDYSGKDKLFYFLYKTIERPAMPPYISKSLVKAYKELGIDEMLEQYNGGKKMIYKYPPESYKRAAIYSMLNNGVNILYLMKLTKLDIGTLALNFDFDKKIIIDDLVSTSINNGLINTEYYTYL